MGVLLLLIGDHAGAVLHDEWASEGLLATLPTCTTHVLSSSSSLFALLCLFVEERGRLSVFSLLLGVM